MMGLEHICGTAVAFEAAKSFLNNRWTSYIGSWETIPTDKFPTRFYLNITYMPHKAVLVNFVFGLVSSLKH